MIIVHIPDTEFFDEASQTFVSVKACQLRLEHSLIALQEWESKWHKPYLADEPKTREEDLDYIRCMTLDKNIDSYVYYALPETELRRIREYMNDPMTARTFSQRGHGGRDIITAEAIYYYMIELNIPFECRKWHLNQLTTLIRVCSDMRAPKKKMSPSEMHEINKARRAKARLKGGKS